MIDKSPFRRLAVPEFLKIFGDLLKPTAEVTQFERGLIEGTYELIALARYTSDESRAIFNTTHVAYKILEQGAVRSFQTVIKHFVFNIERVASTLNRSWQSRQDAFEAGSFERRALAFMSFYKSLYEGLVPSLFAPILAAMAVSGGRKPAKAYRVDKEGKASLGQLERIQYEWTSQKKQLAQGLNNHLRNSYAHECYRFLDGDRIELWDIDPRTGDYSWGPTVYTESMLIDECEALWRNALGFVYAWALFSINNRKLIDKGNYYTSLPVARDQRRTEEIKDLSEKILAGRGLDTLHFQFEDGLMILKLRCQLQGVDQDSEMFVKSGRTIRKFVTKMRYHEEPVIDQLMGSFQIIRFEIRQEFEFIATVFSTEDRNVGEIRGHTKQFAKYKGTALPDISDFRKELFVDTLGEAKTWMLEESLPKEVL